METKIYLASVKDYASNSEAVMTAFTDREAAQNYCDYWNEHTANRLFWVQETNLDRYAEIYKNKY